MKSLLSLMRTVGLIHAVTLTTADPSPGCSLPQKSGSWTTNVPFDGGSYEHAYTYPDTASSDNPAPLILFFHGWGGDSTECGSTCDRATERGYATIALTGIGEDSGDWNSWNGFGSTQSSSGVADAPELALVAGEQYCDDETENDRTCDLDAYEVECYSDCNGECADECWWTTCKDSVQQTLEVLEDFINNYCVDMNRIYALGWSNGGMFTYELANDERTAKYLAAISPQIGLPHYGYNRGPHPDFRIHHFGLWGESDDVVPPKESPSAQGCTVPCRTSQIEGWFFTSSECVMEKWATDLELSPDESIVDSYGISDYDEILECSGYTWEEAVVLGCIFDGGHYNITDYHDEVALNFFDTHSKIGESISETSNPTISPSEYPISVDPTLSPSVEAMTGNPSGNPSGEPQITPMPSLINEQSSLPTSDQIMTTSTVMTTELTSPAPIQLTEQPTSGTTNAPITSPPSPQPSEQTIPTVEPTTEQPNSQLAPQSEQPISNVSSEIPEVNAQSQPTSDLTSAPTSSGVYVSLLPMPLLLVVFFF